MADDKKKKKKKKEDADTSTEPEAPPSTPAPSRPTSKKSTGSKKVKKGGGSNVFEQFTQKQVAEFKEGFQFIDRDKDGLIGKTDIRETCDELGRMTTEEELDSMIADAPGPLNFTMLINMFGQRQQGGAADEDDVVIDAWKAFTDENGLIDAEKMKFDLTHFGEKYSEQELQDFLDQIEITDDGKFECNAVCDMMTGKLADEE